ncbi:MAG: hypothetical protein ACI9MR_002040 [Myxococcota bacterium]
MSERVVIPRTRSLVAAGGALVGAAISLALTITLVIDVEPALGITLATLGVGGLFAAGLLSAGVQLLSPRGGLVVDDATGRVGLGVTGPNDTWWLPREDVEGLHVMPGPSLYGSTVEDWQIVLALKHRPPVILAQSQDRSTIVLLARSIADKAGFDSVDEAYRPPPTGAIAAELKYAVHRGAALQRMLLFFGISLLVVGVAMMTRVATDPVFGFLFGPLMAFLGGALFVVTLVKRFGAEELASDGIRFTHRYRIGPFRWAERTIRAERPRWRIYIHGLRGAQLELIGEDGILVLAAGATSKSRIDLTRVAEIPKSFSTLLDPPSEGV